MNMKQPRAPMSLPCIRGGDTLPYGVIWTLFDRFLTPPAHLCLISTDDTEGDLQWLRSGLGTLKGICFSLLLYSDRGCF